MIYEIGSGSGIYCSEGAGARVYFIARPEPMLIDTGAAGRGESILRDLANVGFQPIQLRKIILTHYHSGHTGSLWELKRRSGALALAHHADAPYIAGKRHRRAGHNPVERVFHSTTSRLTLVDQHGVAIDRTLEDNDLINGWRVLHTPGHTPGHICLFRGDVLISGDMLLASAGGFRETPHATTADLNTYRASLRQIAELDFNLILPGHNPPYVVEANSKVRELVARLDGE